MVTSVEPGPGTAAPDVDFLSGTFWAGPHHEELAWLRRHDPVHWDGRVWGVTRHALVKEIARRPDIFSNRQGMRPDLDPLPMMTDLDDPEHKARRALVGRAFSPRRIQAEAPAVRKACAQLLDEVSPLGGCDFVTDVAAWLPMIMIGDALGVAPEDRGTLLGWSDDMVRGLVDGPGHDEAMTQATESFLEFREYLLTAIADRRVRPTEDVLSVLVHAEIDGVGLDDEVIVQEASLLLLAGDETTRHVLSGGLYQLLRHREQWERLRNDPSLVPSAVEEMLRWVSPVKNMGRTVLEPVELGGRQLSAGDDVLLIYPAANRDESVFDEPDRFDITRAPNDHLAFGIGSHFCLGAALARLELVCLFETLLERLPDLDLVDDREPPDRGLNFVTGYETLPVTYAPRPSCPMQHHPIQDRGETMTDTVDLTASVDLTEPGPSTGEPAPAAAPWVLGDERWHAIARAIHHVEELRASGQLPPACRPAEGATTAE